MIGVFDSGHGGLTILRALVDRFPHQSFAYFGDHAHAPYGQRAPEDIFRLTQKAVDFLFRQKCDLVILACNTASAVALRRLQQEWLPQLDPYKRILGVIVPTVEAVTHVPWQDKQPHPGQRVPAAVGVFATPRTVESKTYVQEITSRAPEIKVVQQACPGLAGRIEKGAGVEEVRALVQGYVEALLEQTGGHVPDSVLLGCTHYPLIAQAFVDALPKGTTILSQPALVAESLERYLKDHPQFRTAQEGKKPVHLFFTTGNPTEVGGLAAHFFQEVVTYAKADITY